MRPCATPSKTTAAAATIEEFYELYDQYVQGPDLSSLKSLKEPDVPIKDGPAVPAAICAQGVPEGTRNNALFNIGIYLKKAHPQVHWDNLLVEYNFKYVSPRRSRTTSCRSSSSSSDKRTTSTSARTHRSTAFCNSGLCRTRKHGIGAHGPDAPQLSALSKYNSEPPLWFLDVNGKRMELDTESLLTQMAFQKACVEKLNILPPTPCVSRTGSNCSTRC
jgi:hypothetical protein